LNSKLIYERILTGNPESEQFINSGDYSGASRILLEMQKKSWKDLSEGYNNLKAVKTKSFQFEGFTIRVQFNPGRFISTTAKVDPESINSRKCFLCAQNLPKEQKGIKYRDNYLILANPYPIFNEHFTITHINHIPQEISGWFRTMLLMSKDFSKHYTIIYNGPKCGASAPDHLHFQAGNKFFIPVDNEFHSLKNEYGKIILGDDGLVVAGIDDSLRRFISIETADLETAEKSFKIFYDVYRKAVLNDDEPMMNILSFYEEEYGWRVIIFLRVKHRSSLYFKEGEDNILLSPAAVDLGGVCITPLEKDFDKLNKDLLTEIFREVSLGKEQFDYIKSQLKSEL
jgi:hypothetical protein